MKVLLVDDDTDLLDVTAYALRREGFNVVFATDGAQAVQRWEADQPDVVILDVNLPRMTGFEVCRRIRQSDTTPVIMMTALNDDDSVVKGFRAGADDYVTKPFSARQLTMRILAVWRRVAGAERVEPARELRVGDLVLDVEAHEASRNGRTIHLTSTEFRLLYLLASNVGRVVSTDRLVEYAWGYDGGDRSLLKTHFSHIRRKLHLPRTGSGSICAVPGAGYRLASYQAGVT